MKDYEQMRKELKEHCTNYVVDDPFEITTICGGCPLEDFKPCLCTNPHLLSDGEVEVRYNQLRESRLYRCMDEPFINVKSIMEEKPIEHDGCVDCKHMCKTGGEYPCNKCKGNTIVGTDEYFTRPDLYEPMGNEEPNDPVNPNHYKEGIECIEEMLLVFGKRVVADFCLCNVWKYRYRATTKNGDEDIQKSHWYMAKYKEIVDGINDCYTFDAYSNGVTCAEECCDDWECK
jgi:hypothetical protein